MADKNDVPVTRRQALLGYAGLGVSIAGASMVPGRLFAQDSANAIPPWRLGVPLPLAVQEIYPAVHQERIHVAGGIFAEDGTIGGATAQHFSWGAGEAAWREEAPLPSARHHPNLVSAGGSLLALGGFLTRDGALDWTMTDETLVYYAGAGAWTTGPKAPEPHGETVCVARDGLVHVIGGRIPKRSSNMVWTDHIDSDRHLVFDPASGVWERAAPAPTKRNSAAGALYDGAVHVVGGRQVDGVNVTTHEVWDAREDRWRTAAPMPDVSGRFVNGSRIQEGQGGLAAAVISGKLVALGGEYFDAEGGGVFRQVWLYDAGTDEWQAGPGMMTPRHGLGAVSIGQNLYAIGGATEAGGNGTSTLVEVLTL